MMQEPLQATAYGDVNAALDDLLAGVQAALGGNFVGMYLIGSLALGDFDPRGSDIDFVVVTAGEVSDDQFTALQNMHRRFDTSGSPWAEKIEAVYIQLDAPRSDGPAGGQYPRIEKGRSLYMDGLESGWIFQCYTIREHGVVLAGPTPRTLLDPLDPDDMRRAVAAIPLMWLGQARDDPSWLEWLNVKENQAFVVLTLCRLLYTLETADVASKPAAARWTQEALDLRWAGLIEGARVGQHDSEAIPDRDEEETVALIEYTVERYRRWENLQPN